jgi:hypothetical protein
MNEQDFTHFGKAFMIVHHTISNELDLRNTRDCLEIGMEDRLLRVACLVVSMTIDLRIRVEGLLTRV